jgi:hypothetical protein
VWATARFHTHDALRGQRTADGEQALVFFGVDIVGDGDEVVFVSHGFAQHFQQGGFSRAHGPADAHTQGWQFFGAMCDGV